MTLEIVTVPCLDDNYAFIAHDPASGQTMVVDVPDAGPIASVLDSRGWTLSHVLLTHHHADHVQGLDTLMEGRDAQVIGAAADAARLPPLDLKVAEGDSFDFGGERCHVLDVSGHTVGHIAVHIPGAKAAFTADSLMALGCGRVFEGTPQQMWQSLQKLAALPPETTIYSGHEYTATNARFALTIDPENSALICRKREIDAARAEGHPTVPSTLAIELATNPFLRAADPAIRSHLGMQDAPDEAVFAEIRARKDRF